MNGAGTTTEFGAPALEDLEKVYWYDPVKLGHFHARELLAASAFALSVAGVFAAEAAVLAGLLPSPAWVRGPLHLAALAGACCVAYGVLLEPYRMTVRRVSVASGKVKSPVRLLHMGDLHVRRWSRVEEGLVAAARSLSPDAILLSGDYSAAPGSYDALARVFRELAAVAPVYAALGNSELIRPVHARLRLKGLTWLDDDDRAVSVRGTPLRVYGIRPGSERNFWQHGRKSRPFELGVVLYHFPDFAPKLDVLPYDLMLCGHTHGGQVRLPVVGALLSLSRAGTDYAEGVFRAEGRTAVVTRGVGCEGYGLPRFRFLCPPEVVVVDLVPLDPAR